MNSAALITSHLNAPFGGHLREADLAQSLRAGELAAQTDQANAILSYLFIETEPRLIASCALEVGSDVATANRLYLITLDHASPGSPTRESAIKDIL